MDKSLQAYYTNSNSITDYMVSKLNLSDDDTVFEPSAGEGVFIDKILLREPRLSIHAYDIDDYSYEVMKQKYTGLDNVIIHKTDTLLDKNLDFLVDTKKGFSKIIGNPPYGAKLETSIRDQVNKKYSTIYSKDTYVLFFYRCLSLLKEEGKLVFIIPDTFLYLNMHKNFRKYLFNNFVVEEICLFPSKLFPGVGFAYSKLSIITVRNSKKEIFKNEITIFSDITDKEEFMLMANGQAKPVYYKQSSILENPNFNLRLNKEFRLISRSSNIFLGDLADCVTGIYTGNNKAFLKVLNSKIRNSKGYSTIAENEIYSKIPSLEGIDDNLRTYIPIVKGSIRVQYMNPKDEWFINWSKDAIYHYLNDRKARFQNASFYFRQGIAIPMLKSTKINAALMQDRVFDQSIVGVFPREPKYLYFILAMLNSDIVNEIIHDINPTVNNSANYLKRIPIPDCDQATHEKINLLVEGIILRGETNESELNNIFANLYSKDN